MKKCCRCSIEKQFNDFHKNKHSKDGYKAACKECRKKESKEAYDPVKQKEYREANKDKRKKNHKDWYFKNREKRLKQKKEWREANKEKTRQYRIDNKDKIREWNRKNRENPLVRLKDSCRSRIRLVIKNKSYSKNKTTEDMLGCSWEDLKKHLESQFTEGMTWDNYGKWHIDHIKPLCLAKTEEEMYKLNHFSNLQPLWAIDNLSKGGIYNVPI
jgi:hypothetical protein